jgi:hypothetical protein
MSDLPASASSLLYQRHIEDRAAALMRPILHDVGSFQAMQIGARTSTPVGRRRASKRRAPLQS